MAGRLVGRLESGRAPVWESRGTPSSTLGPATDAGRCTCSCGDTPLPDPGPLFYEEIWSVPLANRRFQLRAQAGLLAEAREALAQFEALDGGLWLYKESALPGPTRWARPGRGTYGCRHLVAGSGAAAREISVQLHPSPRIDISVECLAGERRASQGPWRAARDIRAQVSDLLQQVAVGERRGRSRGPLPLG